LATKADCKQNKQRFDEVVANDGRPDSRAA
jgi:hypothetical protein